MTAIQPPLYIGVDGEIGADELGLPFRDLVGEGVIASGDFAVTQRGAGANMSVDVAPGAAWVKGDTDANAQPTYRVRNDATVNVAIAGADASKPRIDRVVARVYDSAFLGTSLTWDIEVITGTPTTGATLANLSGAAAVPATALLLANVLVPAAAASIVTADIGDVRTRAQIGGAILAPGAEIGYDEVTASVFPSAVTSATANTVIAGSAHTFDGAPVIAEFYCGAVGAPSGAAGNIIRVGLFEGATLLDYCNVETDSTGNQEVIPVVLRRRLTPSAGPHTYSIKSWVNTGTGGIFCGPGGAGGNPPAYLRITKV